MTSLFCQTYFICKATMKPCCLNNKASSDLNTTLDGSTDPILLLDCLSNLISKEMLHTIVETSAVKFKLTEDLYHIIFLSTYILL